MDKLQTMMEMQKQFQERVGFNFETMSESDKADYCKEMMLWTIDEMGEALHELKYAKHWSKKYDSWTDEETEERKNKFKDEMVDSFHFFMNVLLASGMDADELFERYLEKNKINIERQNTGY